MTDIATIERTGAQRMAELCNSFPVLRGGPGTDPWDQEKFALSMRGASTAEKQAAAFVLSVWNGWSGGEGSERAWFMKAPYRIPRFDAVSAISVWDGNQVDAFLDWCEHPFWP